MNGLIQEDEKDIAQAISSYCCGVPDSRPSIRYMKYGRLDVKNPVVTKITVRRFRLFIVEFDLIIAKITKTVFKITNVTQGSALKIPIIVK